MIIVKPEMIRINPPLICFVDAVFDGVFHQGLEHHRGNGLIECGWVDIHFDLQSFFKPHMFQGEVIFNDIQFLFQGNGFQFFCSCLLLRRILLNLVMAVRALSGFRLPVPVCCSGVKDKMGIDMGFDGFEFK